MVRAAMISLVIILSAIWAQAETPDTSPASNAVTTVPATALPQSIRAFHAMLPGTHDRVGDYEKFIREVLAPAGVNVLILEVSYKFQYKSVPRISMSGATTAEDVKLLLKACRENGIKLIPEFNCLSHQGTTAGTLLGEYPQYQEKPGKLNRFFTGDVNEIQYMESPCYCPLEPEVHRIVFALLDELADVFETDTIHAGMDEAFDIASTNCPRCAGKDPSVLYAGEVNAIHAHLAGKGIKMWMWGDRLIVNENLGFNNPGWKDAGWQTSVNGTERAIDMIPKDIVICDWHYEKAFKSPYYFASKGFDVISCSFWNQEAALGHLAMMRAIAADADPDIAPHARGVMLTTWVHMPYFIDAYYGKIPPPSEQVTMKGNPNFPWKAAERCVGVFKAVTAVWGR